MPFFTPAFVLQSCALAQGLLPEAGVLKNVLAPGNLISIDRVFRDS